VLGHIGAAHGIRGEVVLQSYTAEPADITSYGPLSDETGRRTFVVESVRSSGKGLIARIAGVTDRDAAEALRGTRLYVDRAQLPEVAEDEYYHEDLIGLAAVLETGEPFGKVVAVQNFGAGDLIEIAPVGSSQTVLVPFTRACVPEVDIAAGCVVVTPPEGLIDVK
jgi:16S rRNA processing protein RimM